MNDRIKRLLVQIDALRSEYYDYFKREEFEYKTAQQIAGHSKTLNQIASRMLSVESELRESIKQLHVSSKNIYFRQKKNMLPKRADVVTMILKGEYNVSDE